MASQIHKRRTGKLFHLTESIVVNDEMYEEEDDYTLAIKRCGHEPGPVPPVLISGGESDLQQQMIMSELLSKQNEQSHWNDIVERLFEQSFPNAREQAHQLSQGYLPPVPSNSLLLNVGDYNGISTTTSPASVNFEDGLATPGCYFSNKIDTGMHSTEQSLSENLVPSEKFQQFGGLDSMFTTALPPEAPSVILGSEYKEDNCPPQSNETQYFEGENDYGAGDVYMSLKNRNWGKGYGLETQNGNGYSWDNSSQH